MQRSDFRKHSNVRLGARLSTTRQAGQCRLPSGTVRFLTSGSARSDAQFHPVSVMRYDRFRPLTSGFIPDVAPSTGIEPVACRLGGDRSIQLSYEGVAGARGEQVCQRRRDLIVDDGSAIRAGR